MSPERGRWSRPFRGRYFRLGSALFVLALMYPMLGYGLTGRSSWTVAFWMVLWGALHAVESRHRIRTLARILAAVAVVAGVAGLACYGLRESGHAWIFTVFDGLTLLFLLVATTVVLVDVLAEESITGDHLMGAVCVYVLLGLTFAYVLPVLDGFSTTSILVSSGPRGGEAPVLDRADYLYFSFVTLSTLGYGDLVPATLTARLVAGVEAILGQLFLTILVARLIGLHVSRSRAGNVRHGG